jgi:hypothetical protein
MAYFLRGMPFLNALDVLQPAAIETDPYMQRFLIETLLSV